MRTWITVLLAVGTFITLDVLQHAPVAERWTTLVSWWGVIAFALVGGWLLGRLQKRSDRKP